MNRETITTESIDELLRFLPLFNVPGRQFVTQWAEDNTSEKGAVAVPYPIYADDVTAFFQLAGQVCWSDTEYDPVEAGKMVVDDKLIEQATLEQIKTMLTYCVRGERFCEGHWDRLLKSGRVTAILQRLTVLQEAW